MKLNSALHPSILATAFNAFFDIMFVTTLPIAALCTLCAVSAMIFPWSLMTNPALWTPEWILNCNKIEELIRVTGVNSAILLAFVYITGYSIVTIQNAARKVSQPNIVIDRSMYMRPNSRF